MKGLASVRILRIKLYLERKRDQGHLWATPLFKLAKSIQKLHRRSVRGPSGPLGSQAQGQLPCPIPFREMVINCDGAAACGSTAGAPLLDAYRDDEPRALSQVWEGKAFNAMRSRMLAEDPSGCAGCQLYRCPGFEPLSDEERTVEPPGGRSIQQLLIEPTALCNLDCPTICGQSYPKARQPVSRRKARFMSMAMFRRIVEGIDRPIEKICFYNYGEPLLHPDFFAMCRLMRERCPTSHIVTSTNGSRLADARIRAGLLDSGLDEIIISLDGAQQSTYEVYRRGGRFDQIIEGMRLLRRERDERGLTQPRLIWRYILFAWNDGPDELERAEELAREIGVDQFCYHLSDLPEMASQTYLPGTAAYDRIREKIF